MLEISTWFAWLWTLATFIFSAGFGWAGIKYGQKGNSDAIKKMDGVISEMNDCVKSLQIQLVKNESRYVWRDDCKIDQEECGKHRDYHESQICKRLAELTTIVKQLDEKRDKGQDELRNRLGQISEELAVIKDRNHTHGVVG